MRELCTPDALPSGLQANPAPGHGRLTLVRKNRYLQWLTPKLVTWHAQFGRSGCFGCGRCLGWDPVAIDLTEGDCALTLTEALP